MRFKNGTVGIMTKNANERAVFNGNVRIDGEIFVKGESITALRRRVVETIAMLEKDFGYNTLYPKRLR